MRSADGLASRIDPDLPVIVLTGRAGDSDRVRGFARGADDYVVKPFLYQELLGADPRGAAPGAGAAAARRDAGGRADDRPAHARRAPRRASRCTCRPRSSRCSRRWPSSPRAWSRKADLLRDVWGYLSLGNTRTVDAHACRLRKKLAAVPAAVGGERARGGLPADGGAVSAAGGGRLGGRARCSRCGSWRSGAASSSWRGPSTSCAARPRPCCSRPSGCGAIRGPRPAAGSLRLQLERLRAGLGGSGRGARGGAGSRPRPVPARPARRWRPRPRPARGRWPPPTAGRVRFDWRAGSPRVSADRGRLAQVLANLTANARRARRGTVEVRGRERRRQGADRGPRRGRAARPRDRDRRERRAGGGRRALVRGGPGGHRRGARAPDRGRSPAGSPRERRGCGAGAACCCSRCRSPAAGWPPPRWRARSARSRRGWAAPCRWWSHARTWQPARRSSGAGSTGCSRSATCPPGSLPPDALADPGEAAGLAPGRARRGRAAS